MSSKAAAEKSLKNYLYDNPELKASKSKKASSELAADFGDETEVWLLQCPKGFDPSKMMNSQLGSLGKQMKMECSADRFSETKNLAVIAPEKVAEYEIICDKLKLVSDYNDRTRKKLTKVF